MDGTPLPLPWFGGRQLFVLVTHLAVILVDFVDRVLHSRRWVPVCRLAGLVVLAVVVVVVLRIVPSHPMR